MSVRWFETTLRSTAPSGHRRGLSDALAGSQILRWGLRTEPGQSIADGQWGGYANVANYPPALRSAGLYFSQALIWVKEHPVLTRKDFHGQPRMVLLRLAGEGAHRFLGPPNVPDVWSVKKVNPASMIHLTEKPVELARRALLYSSLAGEHVLDPFGGSGSTLIAAEETGRRAYLAEIDPRAR